MHGRVIMSNFLKSGFVESLKYTPGSVGSQLALARYLIAFEVRIISQSVDNASEYNFFESKINFLAADWLTRIENGLKDYSELMKRPTEAGISEKDDWIIMQSMREVDADTYVEIKQTFSANLSQNKD